MKLSSIYIYPIKSLKGIELTEAQVEERGFRYDRRWMLVDSDGKMITQRQCPRMATISVSIASEGLRVVAPGTEALDIPFNIDNNQKIPATVWEDTCAATLVGKFADDWFKEYLKIPCRLVHMPELTKRFANPNYNVKNSIVSFADGFQFLLIGQSSLDDLNSKLAIPLPMLRFRPNLVVTGSSPFVEDTWKKIEIGSTLFHVVKPCARCVITTIDQKTGEKGKEPLQTLNTYRNFNGQVWFGQNLIPANTGWLKSGDAVTILE